jgi:hypothetical protein
MLAAERVADDVVHLLLAAGAHAARALDAGIEVHRDAGVGNIGLGLLPGFKPGQSNPELARPAVHPVDLGVALLRHVGEQQLDHHLLRSERARAVGGDLHPLRRVAAAGRREHALALHFDHAGAAVAVGPQGLRVAQVRDDDAVLLRRLDDGLVRAADHGLAVQLELDRQCRELLRADAVHARFPSSPLPAGSTSSP